MGAQRHRYMARTAAVHSLDDHEALLRVAYRNVSDSVFHMPVSMGYMSRFPAEHWVWGQNSSICSGGEHGHEPAVAGEACE
mmetsp:Transcript_34213/g.107867  ORF Transcript_34213/g.107867 Transcript_34213/m.107867 type:complete len:81 (+) Transcript_34213:775-1017(+)